ADTRELHRVVTLGRAVATGRQDVSLSGAPHERDHLVQWIADTIELFDRYGGRASEQVSDHEVSAEATRDVERLRAHLESRRRHRERLQGESFTLREVLQNRHRLATRGV